MHHSMYGVHFLDHGYLVVRLDPFFGEIAIAHCNLLSNAVRLRYALSHDGK